MDTQSWIDNKNMRAALIILLALGALFLLVKTLKEVKNFDNNNGVIEHVISVTGKGEVTTISDIATFTFSASEEGKTVKEAQDKATEKNNKAITYLKNNGVEDRDIKTIDYNVYPKYTYPEISCRGGACPPATQTISGFQVSQTIEVKVRDTSKAGDLLSGLGGIGVSNISGLQFTSEDKDKLARDARSKAIEDAEEQAEKLARDLGVDLGDIVSFSESGGGFPMPYYAKEMAADGAAVMNQSSPQVPQGENKITSYVTITYEIND